METIELRVRLNFSERVPDPDLRDLLDRFRQIVEEQSEEGGQLSIENNEVCDFDLEHERTDDDS